MLFFLRYRAIILYILIYISFCILIDNQAYALDQSCWDNGNCNNTCPSEVLTLNVSIDSVYYVSTQLFGDFTISASGQGWDPVGTESGYRFEFIIYAQGWATALDQCLISENDGLCVTCNLDTTTTKAIPDGTITFYAVAAERHGANGIVCACTSFVPISVVPPPLPDELGPIPCESQMGDPVDARSGNMFFNRTDVSINTWYNIPISFNRSYNSGSKYEDNSSILGLFWTHSFDITATDIVINNDSLVVFRLGNGKILKLRNNMYPIGLGHHYYVETDTILNGYVITDYQTGKVYHFNNNGSINYISDRTYEQIFITHNNGLIDSIYDNSGRSIKFNYNVNNNLDNITDNEDSVIVTYVYDTVTGDTLKGVYYSDGKWEEYRYEEQLVIKNVHDLYYKSYLREITNSDSVSRFFQYDHSGRCSRSYGEDYIDDYSTYYFIDAEISSDTLFYFISGETGLNSKSYTSIFSSDKTNRAHILISNSDCSSCADSIELNVRNEKVGLIYANGVKDSVNYDLVGNIVNYWKGLGESFEQSLLFSYEGPYNLINSIDVPSAVCTLYTSTNILRDTITWDVESIINYGFYSNSYPYYDTTFYDYNDKGQITKINSPLQLSSDTTKKVYYSNGDLRYNIKANGDTIEFSQLDKVGNLTWIVSPNSDTTRFLYSYPGILYKVIENAGENDSLVTIYDRNFRGEITKVTFPQGNYLQFDYDEHESLTDIINSLGEKIHYDYDDYSRRTKMAVIDSLGDTTITEFYTYDTNNKIYKITKPDSSFVQYLYDDMGNINALSDNNGYSTWLYYDLENNIDSIKQLNGLEFLITKFDHDANGKLTKIIDPESNEYVFMYSDNGLLTYDSSNVLGPRNYTYDAAGNLKSIVDTTSDTVLYNYDALSRLTYIDYLNDSLNITYLYDLDTLNGKGRLYREEKDDVVIDYRYDNFGRIKKEIQYFRDTNFTITYSYDKNDNLIKIKYPSGGEYIYTYNDADQISGILWQIDESTLMYLVSDIQYYPYGAIKSMTYYNDITMDYSYDDQYRLMGISTGSDSLIAQSYLYDSVGNIKSIYDSLDTDYNVFYSYDSLYRLRTATCSSFVDTTIEYLYDGIGNRIKIIHNQDTTVYEYIDNKLTNIFGTDTTTILYDNKGRMIQLKIDLDSVEYVYDDASRLISVSNDNFYYNSRNQRYSKDNGTIQRNYIYSYNGLMLNEYRSLGWEADYIYLYGMPIAKIMKEYESHIESGDSLIGMMGSGPIDPPPDTIIDPPPTPPQFADVEIFFYHNDHLGTPLYITDTTKTIRWSGKYLPFGNLYEEYISTPNYFRFPGQWDEENNGLYYNWHRYFSPDIGRYITPDPIGLAGGINMYVYVGGNPITKFDHTGLTNSYIFNLLIYREFILSRVRNIPNEYPDELVSGADKAVTPCEFLAKIENKTLQDLTTEGGPPEWFNLNFTAGGPLNSYRYVKDPANDNQIIDMRHVIVVGQTRSEDLAAIIEAVQVVLYPSGGSAFNAQDIFSNYLGFEYFNKYYNSSDQDLVNSFESFFQDRAKMRKK